MPQQHFCDKLGEFSYPKLLRNIYFIKNFGNSLIPHSLFYSPKNENTKRIYLKFCQVLSLLEKPGEFYQVLCFKMKKLFSPAVLTFLSRHFFTSFQQQSVSQVSILYFHHLISIMFHDYFFFSVWRTAAFSSSIQIPWNMKRYEFLYQLFPQQ